MQDQGRPKSLDRGLEYAASMLLGGHSLWWDSQQLQGSKLSAD